MNQLRAYLRPETCIFIVLWLGFLAVGRTQLFRDPGTYWHIVVGERILDTGRFPEVDEFSFTCTNQPWLATNWLGEIAMAGVNRWLGFDGLLLMLATMLAALYAWAAHRLIRVGLHWSLAVVLIALALAASVHNWHVRPHMATLFALALTYGLLLDVDSQRRSVPWLLWLPALFLLWANAHGGVLGGLATLITVLTGWIAERFLGGSSPLKEPKHFLTCGAVLALCCASLLLNPYLHRTLLLWLDILGFDLPDIIQEHRPLNPGELSGMGILAFGLVFILVLIGVLPQWPRIAWLVPLLWLSQAWARNRHGPLFAITALLAIAEIMPHTRWAAYLTRKGSDWFQPPAEPTRLGLRPLLLPLVLVMTALLMQSTRLQVPLLGHGWVKEDSLRWPVDLMPELERLSKTSEQPVPIFNDMLYGGYVIYHLPQMRVFVDDRCELYGNQSLHDYAEAERSQPERLSEWQKRWGFKLVLTENGSQFDRYLQGREEWKELRRGASAVLYQYGGPR